MNSILSLLEERSRLQTPNTTIPVLPSASVYLNAYSPLNAKVSTLNPLPSLNGSISPSDGGRTRASSINSLSPVGSFSPVQKKPQLPINSDVQNLLLTWQLQQKLQSELFNQQMSQILDLKQSLLQKLSDQPQQVEVPKLNIPIPHKEPMVHVPVTIKNDACVEVPALFNVKPSQTYNANLKDQIKDIIHYILENFGRVGDMSFEEEKLKYSNNKDLIAVFDILTSKYASTIKTKEEMIKYTLRRALKYMKSNLKKEKKANTKAVSQVICSKYFNASEDEIHKIGNEEDYLKSVLPFRKNSKNKTMNTSFICDMFSSDDFCRDYEIFVEHFGDILEDDNKSKIERLAVFIEECLKKNKLKDLKNYKRIPWLKLWIVNTKQIAQTLPNLKDQPVLSPEHTNKKLHQI